MDKILIKQLTIETQIGVLAYEQQIKQKILLDLELGTDIRDCAAKDDITLTLDYAAISDTISTFANDYQCQLIETLAEDIASLIFKQFPVTWLKLSLTKPNIIANAKSVGVTIERQKEGKHG